MKIKTNNKMCINTKIIEKVHDKFDFTFSNFRAQFLLCITLIFEEIMKIKLYQTYYITNPINLKTFKNLSFFS